MRAEFWSEVRKGRGYLELVGVDETMLFLWLEMSIHNDLLWTQ
jgi:hypothetical protein